MKNDCSVVKDLIPLYAEGLVSEETKEFIYEHCQSCEKCKGLLDTIADFSDSKETIDDRKEKMWNDIANKERKKKRKRYILLSLGALTLILATVYIYSFHVKGNTWFMQYEPGISSTYNNSANLKNYSHPSKDEVEEAAKAVQDYFKNNFGGAVMFRLSYDESYTIDKKRHEYYPNAIVFSSDFYYLYEPGFSNGSHEQKGFTWWVDYDTSLNQWKVVSCGYG